MRYLIGAAVALMVTLAAAQQAALQRFSGYQGDARSCTLCLEEASSQTDCAYTDPSTPEFNFECLCLPASQATTQGCAGFCQDTTFSAEAQCPPTYQPAMRAVREETDAATGDAQDCDLCLEQAAQQTNCTSNDAGKPGYDFDCMCQQPGFSEYTMGCSDFCKMTDNDIEVQCSKVAEPAERSAVTFLECSFCVMAICGDLDYECLCSAEHIKETTACDYLCPNAPTKPSEECYQLHHPLRAPLTLDPRNPQSQTVTPGFGFCGPRGVNCKSTEYAGPPHVERATEAIAEPPLIKRAAITARGKGKKTSSQNASHSGMRTAYPKSDSCGVSGSNCVGHAGSGHAEHEQDTSATTQTSTAHVNIIAAIGDSQVPTAALVGRDAAAHRGHGNGSGHCPGAPILATFTVWFLLALTFLV